MPTSEAHKGSVVIPAHNEQSVIGRCLDTLIGPAGISAVNDIQVIVVGNGCTDETAAIVRKYTDVTLLEIQQPSKTAALNAGEEVATRMPRIYLDADSELSRESALSLLHTANSHDKPCIVSADVILDTTHCSMLARCFSRCSRQTSFGELGIVGRGVYVLNAAGRSRFEEFPELINDDSFVASLFNLEEQIIDKAAKVIVRPPADLSSLLRVRTRVYFGNAQKRPGDLRKVSPHSGWRNVTHAIRRIQSPSDLLDLLVYVSINFAAKHAAARMRRSGSVPLWRREGTIR